MALRAAQPVQDAATADEGRAVLAAALRYAAAGIHVFPARVRPRPDGKKDYRPISSWPSAATTDEASIRGWFETGGTWAGALLCAATDASGLDVIDADGASGLTQWRALLGEHGAPETWRSRTPGGGEHWLYRAVPDDQIRTDAKFIAPAVDTRGSANGFVVLPPSQDFRGSYTWLEGEPEWSDLPKLPRSVVRAARRPDRAAGTSPVEWSDDVRPITADDGREQYRGRLADATQGGDHWRQRGLYLSALDGWRLFHLGHLTADEFRDDLQAISRRVWGAPLDSRDLVIIGEAEQKATRSPWTLTGGRKMPPTAPFSPDAGAGPTAAPPEPSDADPDAHALELRKRSLRLDQRARREVAAEDREPLRVLRGGAFLDGEDLTYLVPRMLYRSSTAKVYGPPGGTKSFLLLDLALSLATGRPWHGDDLGRARVHYVMAEGEAVNRLRTRAWLLHHDVPPSELDPWFTAVPQGVLLTPEGIAGYVDLVAEDGPALVILDTKNAMMDGDENSASDVAVMVRAMRAIRDAAAGACVVLVDHTGLTDTTRGRGSGAVTGAMDTEVRVTRDSGPGTAEVTRDKAAEPGASWSYTLRAVPDVPRAAGISAPAVCVPVAGERAARFVDPGEVWNDPLSWPLPADVAGLTGRGAKAARHIALYMRTHAADLDGTGESRTEVVKVMRQIRGNDGQPLYGDDTVIRHGWSRLVALHPPRLLPVTVSTTGKSHWDLRADDPAPR